MHNVATDEDDENIDYSDIPETDEEFWKDATFHPGTNDNRITITLDSEVWDWFQKSYADYGTQVNRALKIYIKNYDRITELLKTE